MNWCSCIFVRDTIFLILSVIIVVQVYCLLLSFHLRSVSVDVGGEGRDIQTN